MARRADSLRQPGLSIPESSIGMIFRRLSSHLIASGLDPLLHHPCHGFGADDITTECLLWDEFEGAESRTRVSGFHDERGQ
jgi:hypothetical protein